MGKRLFTLAESSELYDAIRDHLQGYLDDPSDFDCLEEFEKFESTWSSILSKLGWDYQGLLRHVGTNEELCRWTSIRMGETLPWLPWE